MAHHYVRYLGDLSGGQIVARLVARHVSTDLEAAATRLRDEQPGRQSPDGGSGSGRDTERRER